MEKGQPNVVIVRPGLLGVEVVQMFFYTSELNPTELKEKLALGVNLQLSEEFPHRYDCFWEGGIFHACKKIR